MAIDASIPLGTRPVQVPDQMAGLANVMQLINAQQGVKMGQLQMAKFQRDMADEDATKTAYAAYLRDPTGVSLAELGEKNPKLVQDILKQQREAAKDAAAIEKDRAEADLKRIQAGAAKAERAANILSSAKDQASYELALAALVQNFGPEATQGLPERYDPTALSAKVQEGLKLKERLELVFNEKKLVWEQESKKVDQGIAQQNANSSRISANASATSAGAAVANARTAAARETREATAPKLRYDPELRALVDERTGATRPVTDASGAPLDPKLGTSQQEALQDIARTRSAAEKLRKGFKAKYVGLKGAGGEFNDKWTSQVLPEGLVSDPKRVAFRAQAADLENQYIKSISGASVPVTEVPRLRRAIPTPSDSPAQFEAKLDMMMKNLEELPDLIRKSSQKTASGASAAAPPSPTEFGLKPAGR